MDLNARNLLQDDLTVSNTYLDLVCTDTGVFSESVSNYLMEAARKEYNLFTRSQRFERVQTRLQRVEHFIDYLHEEERRERELYSLGMPEEEVFTYASKKSLRDGKVAGSRERGKNKRTAKAWRAAGTAIAKLLTAQSRHQKDQCSITFDLRTLCVGAKLKCQH